MMRFSPNHGGSAGLSLAQQVMPMSVIAVVNRKGGSGKSTLATHVAAWLAHRGDTVMLGDVDRQHSASQWLTRRRARATAVPALAGWAVDPQRVLRPPVGTTHVVLDTPGGLQGYELARLLGHADLLLLPVCDAAFDLDSASEGLAELKSHPRVASGRVQIAVVGMRTEARGRSLLRLRRWAADQGVAWLGAVPPSRIYPYCAGEGLSVFDLPARQFATQREPWRGITQGLEQLLQRLDAARARPGRPAEGLLGQRGGSAHSLGGEVAESANLAAMAEGDAPRGRHEADALRAEAAMALPAPSLQQALSQMAAARSPLPLQRGLVQAPWAPGRKAPLPPPVAVPLGGWLGWLGALWSPGARRRTLLR